MVTHGQGLNVKNREVVGWNYTTNTATKGPVKMALRCVQFIDICIQRKGVFEGPIHSNPRAYATKRSAQKMSEKTSWCPPVNGIVNWQLSDVRQPLSAFQKIPMFKLCNI